MGYSRKIIVFVCAIFVGNVIAMEQVLRQNEHEYFEKIISPKLNKKLERIGIVQTQSISEALPGKNPVIIFDSMYSHDKFYFDSLKKNWK